MVIVRKEWRIDIDITQPELVVFNKVGVLPLRLPLEDVTYMQSGTPPHVTNPTQHNWLRAFAQASLKQLETIPNGPIDPCQTDFPTRKLIFILDKDTNVVYKVFETQPFREIKEFLGHPRVKTAQPTKYCVTLNG